MGEIVRFPTKPTEPKVALMRNQDTGLFSIICDDVEVCSRLDPIGQRELIRKAALFDAGISADTSRTAHEEPK